ncbi:Proteasome assembly chaperone 3 [Polyrhizophydium stewartii]|uniref:Proteasome assembly chaperone 3 n=1 Tax=Polyrhizophydium stewartii TaxID=2732419 RepID=A0ABR4NHQ1_9FUNG|nr:hypothetical protein HK105_005891 [Polyrhizophydium stewartii]
MSLNGAFAALSVGEPGFGQVLAAAAGSGGEPFPVKTRHAVADVGPHPTELIFMEFANMLALIVTQTGKVGSLSLVTLDAPASSRRAAAAAAGMFAQTEPQDPVTSVKTLLGPRDSPLIHALGSHILAQIARKRPDEERPLLFGLSLADSRMLSADIELGDDFKEVFEGISQFAVRMRVF